MHSTCNKPWCTEDHTGCRSLCSLHPSPKMMTMKQFECFPSSDSLQFLLWMSRSEFGKSNIETWIQCASECAAADGVILHAFVRGKRLIKGRSLLECCCWLCPAAEPHVLVPPYDHSLTVIISRIKHRDKAPVKPNCFLEHLSEFSVQCNGPWLSPYLNPVVSHLGSGGAGDCAADTPPGIAWCYHRQYGPNSTRKG